MIGAHDATVLCLRLTMVALVISALEPLVAWRFFGPRGPLWSKLSRLQMLTSLRAARPVHELMARDFVFITLCAAQIALSAAVFISPDSLLGWVLLLVASLIFVRVRPGLDASDAMTRIVLAANALRLVDPGALTAAFVLFVGMEACLAYFTSGFSKLGATAWIDGRSLAKIVTTVSYGDAGVARVVWRHLWLSRLASWSTVAIEVLFPLVLVVPLPLALALVAGAAMFHLFCARVMALGSFVWAFGATYGCVLSCRTVLPHAAVVEAGMLLFGAVAVAAQLRGTIVELRHPALPQAAAATPAPMKVAAALPPTVDEPAAAPTVEPAS